jgi:tRNA splicing ligase
MNNDIESSHEDTTNFSTSEKFHGQPCVFPPHMHLHPVSLSFDQWSSLEAYTKPPYILTLKSNGCIIFIAALSTSKLLITSKHSIGPVQGASESHAEVGERWLHRHLERAGKTTEQLAETLYAKNWTIATEVRRVPNP